MAIRRFSTAEPGVKSNKFWDQDTAQGALVPIASVTANGAYTPANGFVFDNIPQEYQDLKLVLSYRSTHTSAGGVNLYVNTGTPSDRGVIAIQGDGASSTSWSASNVIGWYNYNPNSSSSLFTTDNIPITSVWDIFNYASTSVFKNGMVRTAGDSNGSGVTSFVVNCVRNTAAITKLTIYTAFGNLTLGSTATLYGIKAGA